jgi:toxin ParE1/3/4
MATKPAKVAYKISIADAAQTDLDDILDWTTNAFGIAGRKRYEALIQNAFIDLLSDPGRNGVRQRNDIGMGICAYHLSTSRKRTTSAAHVAKPRHLVFFRVQGKVIQILRLLHDSMDFARHVYEPG